MAGLNLPAAQATHCCGGPVQPAPQIHAEMLLLRETEYVLAGQLRHLELSGDEYNPPAQFAHALVVEPVGSRNSPGSHFMQAVLSLVLYLPAGQRSHTPVDCLACPALQWQPPGSSVPCTESDSIAHVRHCERSAAAYVPCGHVAQTLVTAPTADEDFPYAHSVHAMLPEPVLYLPDSHGKQISPSTPVKPELHLQSSTLSLPAAESEFETTPKPQIEHGAEPTPALYCPAAHSTHATPPSGPVDPGPQTQSETVEAPDTAEVLPGKQSMHAETPSDEEYLPPTQLAHTDMSSVSVYVPGGQASHLPDTVLNPCLQRQYDSSVESPPVVFLSLGQLVQLDDASFREYLPCGH